MLEGGAMMNLLCYLLHACPRDSALLLKSEWVLAWLEPKHELLTNRPRDT
jgi:hypothetical protein